MAGAQKDSDAAAGGVEEPPLAEPASPEAPSAPAIAADAVDLKAIRSAVVDAAGVSAGLWLSYLFVLFYLLIAAGGVTHRDLFLENPIKLPFLGVELPLRGFFWLGPALLLVVHAYVLQHFVLLASKAGIFDAQLRAQIEDAEVRAQLRRQLPINIFVQFLAGPREVREGWLGFLLRPIAWITLMIGPVALLVFFQLQFLPYHDTWITMWQRIAVVIDLLLLWLLWPTVLYGEAPQGGLAAHRIGPGLVLASISLVSVVLVFTIATFPGEWLNQNLPELRFPLVLAATPDRQTSLYELFVAGNVDDVARKPTSLWSNRLVLLGFDVIDHAKFDTEAKIAAAPEMASLRGRHLEGAVLFGAILRKVDFTGANLQDASLVRAQLQDATLARANLQGALLPFAQLQGASLDYAQLQGAFLDNAQLQGASLENAELQGAILDLAQLQGASLFGAKLQGASLPSAQLQGAWLAFSQLQGASFHRAQLQGASLSGAQLQGALLDDAELQGASLDGAQLQGVSLRQAFVWRADVRDTHAEWARIEGAETSPKRSCGSGGPEDVGAVCDWGDTLDSLKRLIEHDVPERHGRTAIIARFEQDLDPAKTLDGEQEMARHWIELQGASPEPDLYEEKLADAWREIGCAADGAPFVLTGLIRSLSSEFLKSPFAKDSVQVPTLAAAFLREDCAGARGISEDTRTKLMKLRDATPQTSTQPNTQPAKP